MAGALYTAVVPFVAVVLLGCCSVSVSGETCTTGRSYSYYYGYYAYSYTYCSGGCCGYSPNQYCCAYVSVGVIIGAVFAGIAGLCVIVALVCCCIKKQGHAGRVVHTTSTNQPNITVVSSGTTAQYPGAQYPAGQYPAAQYPGTAYGQPMGVQPQQPPPYKTGDIPPAYTYNNPAYPPGASSVPPTATNAFANAAGNA